MSEAAARAAHDDLRRDEEAFVRYLREAAEDGLIDELEAIGLEEARVDCCISRREAKEISNVRFGIWGVAAVAPGATLPEWLAEVLAPSPQASEEAPPPARGEPEVQEWSIQVVEAFAIDGLPAFGLDVRGPCVP